VPSRTSTLPMVSTRENVNVASTVGSIAFDAGIHGAREQRVATGRDRLAEGGLDHVAVRAGPRELEIVEVERGSRGVLDLEPLALRVGEARDVWRGSRGAR